MIGTYLKFTLKNDEITPKTVKEPAKKYPKLRIWLFLWKEIRHNSSYQDFDGINEE